MTEIPLEYWNKLASQLITISSLLSGFSIAVIANLLVNESNTKITNSILKMTTIASGCFLVSVFAMTKILMMTTEGHPTKIVDSDLTFLKLIGTFTFLIGIISLSIVIGLSMLSKSKASPYKLTLILSFVLSDYFSKFRDCKLKTYKIYA
jgi:drug/metabolite transporter (DMT)-like permease